MKPCFYVFSQVALVFEIACMHQSPRHHDTKLASGIIYLPLRAAALSWPTLLHTDLQLHTHMWQCGCAECPCKSQCGNVAAQSACAPYMSATRFLSFEGAAEAACEWTNPCEWSTPIEHHDKNMRAGAGSTACALLLAPPASAAKRQWQRRAVALRSLELMSTHSTASFDLLRWFPALRGLCLGLCLRSWRRGALHIEVLLLG